MASIPAGVIPPETAEGVPERSPVATMGGWPSGPLPVGVTPIPEEWALSLAPATHYALEWVEHRYECPEADCLMVGSVPCSPWAPGWFRLRFENQLGLAKVQPVAKQRPLGPALHVEVISRKFPTLEAHVSFDITKSVWISGDYYAHFGGLQTFTLPQFGFNDFGLGSTSTNTFGVTMAFALAPGYQLLLQYRGDVSQRNGPSQNIFLTRFLWATDLGSILGKGK